MEQKPQIPTLKDSQKPQVKIKGLQAGLSLIDRLKQFKKKDLAFISAGLGVLFMAPLAEHFMMSPEAGGGTPFREGWDFKGNSLGANASPYESGINGLAPGGVTGGGDIITPLNVRDPSSLIMGPGSSQQAPATAVAPPPPAPPAKDEWKDAYANAASRGVQEATKRAALPVPKPSLTNAGLRGLGAVGGGGGGSFTPGAISSQGLTGNRAADSNSLSRVSAAPGFRGVAGPRGGQNASAGSLESLKKASAGALDQMNRSGPSGSALESAAALGMNGGSGAAGRGQGGEGKEDKGGGGNQDKNSSNQGESLEFMRQKAEQEKAIDLKWKKIEQQEMMWPKLKEKMLEELVMAPVKGLAASITKGMEEFGSAKGGKKDVIICTSTGSREYAKPPACLSGTTLGTETGGKCEVKDAATAPSGCKVYTTSGDGTAEKPKADEGAGSVKPPVGAPVDVEGGVKGDTDKLCEAMKNMPADDPTADKGFRKMADKLQNVAIATMKARKATMKTNGGKLDCGSLTVTPVNVQDKPLWSRIEEVDKLLKANETAAFKLLHKATGRAKGVSAQMEETNLKERDAIKAVLVPGADAKTTQNTLEVTAVKRIEESQANHENAAAAGIAEVVKALDDLKQPLADGIKGLNDMDPMLVEVGETLKGAYADRKQAERLSGNPEFKEKPPKAAGAAGEASMEAYIKTIVGRYDQELKNYNDLVKAYELAYVAAANADDNDGRVDQAKRTLGELKFVLKGNGSEGAEVPAKYTGDMSPVPGFVKVKLLMKDVPDEGIPTWKEVVAKEAKEKAGEKPTPTSSEDLKTIVDKKKDYVAAEAEELTQLNNIVVERAEVEDTKSQKLINYEVDPKEYKPTKKPMTVFPDPTKAATP